MLDFLHKALNGMTPAATVVISVALIIFGGFAMTRLTKRLRLPNVTAYILAGMLLGPYCLSLVPRGVVEGMDFLSDIALAFMAFGVGEYFRLETLKKSGARVVVITLFEALLVSALIFAVCYFGLKLGFAFSIVLAALAAATAPASTMMTIRQTHAKGEFVDTLLQVIAMDNVVSLLAYSVAISLALTTVGSSATSAEAIIVPILKNLAVVVIGGLFGVLLKLLIPTKRSTDNRLIITVGVLFGFCGICALMDVSPLLGCMMIGTVYINLTGDTKLFLQTSYFSPPILLLFFVRSGLSFDLGSLTKGGSFGASQLWLIAILYFFIRIVGKYAGAFLGCAAVKKPPKIRNFLGLALIPQAGVAIGLAALGARTLGGELGEALNTVILTSSVLYELVGPVLAKLSLSLSGSYSDVLEELTEVAEVGEDGRKRTELEILIDRIQAIQRELPTHGANDAEQAFTEAAEEQLEAMMTPQKNGLLRRM